MKNKPILVNAGDPRGIFFEIFFKTLKSQKIKSPILLVCCKKILLKEMKFFSFKKKIRIINKDNLDKYKLKNNYLNLIDIRHKNEKKNLNKNINIYLSECFNVCFDILKKKITNKFVNGPINKETFLKKKYLGVTEFISKNFNQKHTGMLIYNKKLSVCPITTHLPLKLVPKKINQKLIIEKIFLIDNFFRIILKKKPKIAVAGLNPHCESILKFNEDKKIILPAIQFIKKKKINVSGPFSADTVFSRKNQKLYDVIIGMYHDQVLTPIKTLFEFNAINITMGLPFLRVTPDHGPNEAMFHKNISNPKSLIEALKFLDKYAA